MKRTLTILLILLSANLIIAQNYVNDPKAKKIIDKLSKETKAYKTIEADFSFKMDNQMEDISEEFIGKVRIKGEKYHLSIMSIETYSDGTTIWTHMPESEELNITNRDPEDDSFLNNPRKIFSLNEEDYKMKYIGKVKKDDISYDKVELYPVKLDQGLNQGDEGSSDLSKVSLLTESTDGSLYEIAYYGKDGNVYTVTLIKFNTNKSISDSEFVFDLKKHPDVEVIDLRD